MPSTHLVRFVRVHAVKGRRCDLLLSDPVFDIRTMYSGIAFEFVKEQINFVRNDGGEIVKILIPVTIKSGREYNPGVVIENYET